MILALLWQITEYFLSEVKQMQFKNLIRPTYKHHYALLPPVAKTGTALW